MMLLTVLLAVLNGPPNPEAETCTVEGQVTLVREGKPVSGAGRVVVYLDEKIRRAVGSPTTHLMRQQDRRFQPEVLVVQKNDSVTFLNKDKEEHNVFSPSPTWFDLQKSKQDATGTHTFVIVQSHPVRCDIHLNMRAEVLVLEHRIFATADASGHYRISGVPPGTRRFKVWEPNGTTAEFTVRQCEGVVRAPDHSLTEGPPPAKVRKDLAPTDEDYPR